MAESKQAWGPNPEEWGRLIQQVEDLHDIHKTGGCGRLRALSAVGSVVVLGLSSWLGWLTVKVDSLVTLVAERLPHP